MFLALSLSLFLSHLFMAMPDILFYTGLLFYLMARCSPMDGVGAERGSGSRPSSDFSWGAFMKKKMWGIVLVASMVFESVQRFMYQIFTHTQMHILFSIRSYRNEEREHSGILYNTHGLSKWKLYWNTV